MTTSPRQFRLFLHESIPSRIDDAEALCNRARAFVQSAGLFKQGFPVELLTRECLVNAIIHGNQKNADSVVDLNVLIGRKWIRLQVRDQGPGFTWRRISQKEIDTTRPSGRGLQICAVYAERIRFNRNGNKITLWIRK